MLSYSDILLTLTPDNIQQFSQYLPTKKVNAIREVRMITGLGLRESHNFVNEFCSIHYPNYRSNR